jgi:hypothetical protein
VPIIWSISTSIGDSIFDYSVGREEAIFIKENELTEYNILTNWLISYDDFYNVIFMNTNLPQSFSCIAPYFEKNICYINLEITMNLNEKKH